MLGKEGGILYILSDEEKSIIGKLIENRRYYKNKEKLLENDKSFLLTNFIKNENGENILNERTYTKLCKGIVVKNDDIYDILLNKLNASYVKSVKMHSEIQHRMFEMKDAILYENEKLLFQLTDSLKRQLKKYSNYIYYREVYEVLKLIEKYSLNPQYMRNAEYEFCERMIGVFQNEMNEIIIYLCNRTYSTQSSSFEEILEWQRKYVEFKNSKLLNPFLALSHLQTGNLSVAKRMLENNIVYFAKTNNYSRILQMYSYKLILLLQNNAKVKKSVDLINEEIQVIIEGIGKNKRLGYLYFEMATQLMTAQFYAESIELFEKAKVYMEQPFCRISLFLQYCHDMISWNEKKIITCIDFEGQEYVLQEYYYLRNINASYETLETYLRKNLFKSQLLEQNVYHNIVKKEVFEVTKITQHYKLLYDFIEEHKNNENL